MQEFAKKKFTPKRMTKALYFTDIVTVVFTLFVTSYILLI